jgi:predicted RNase H-like nuclease
VGKKQQITFTIEIYPGIALVANYSGLFTSDNRKVSYKDIPQNIKDSIIQTAQSIIIR